MLKRVPPFGALNRVWRKLVGNYWSLPLLATLAALPSAFLLLLADRSGWATEWTARDWELVPSAGAAQELVSTTVGVNTALLTLYFSLTLLVLTLATANLGVRLIDRWLERRFVRVSLAGLTFNVVFALVVLAAIDPDAELVELPHTTLWALLVLAVFNIVMLAVALHDLARTIFVDRSIANLAEDARDGHLAIAAATPFSGEFHDTIRAGRSGYVECLDLGTLAEAVRDHEGAIRLLAAPGRHVMKGEALLLLEREGADHEAVCRHIPIGRFRGDEEGSTFDIRLLVEIALRALSPAINDLYTGLACADRLADAMQGHLGLWVDEGEVAVSTKDRRIEMPGLDFRGLYDNPTKALRQGAASYPAMAIRLIENYARVAVASDQEQLVAFLEEKARTMADHALAKATIETDKADIRSALAAFPTRSDPA